ncbi:MAG: exodeoxyribonuclease III [Actinomycetota bacterium]
MAGKSRPFTTVTANVNGIRAAARRGGLSWLADLDADVICLQEVRATHDQVHEQLAESRLAHLHVSHSESQSLGRNGVAVLTKAQPRAMREGLGEREFEHQGRWIETDIDTPFGPMTVVSAYVHTGEAGTAKQEEKFRFLDAMGRRMDALRRRAGRAKGHVLITGDFNVAQREIDIKNWRANRDKAGFLPEERAYLDLWLGTDKPGPWHDLGRIWGGDGPGPYTWWSWRGRGFDTDGGWRIDYQVATPGLAGRSTGAWVGKAAAYAERWSDHAPLVVTFS